MKTLHELIDVYLDQCAAHGAAKSWLYNNRFHLRGFTQWLSSHGVDRPSVLGLKDIMAWQEALFGRRHQRTGMNLRPISLWTYQSAARRFCTWLGQQGYISARVAAEFPIMDMPPLHIRPTLSHAQMKKFLKKLPAETALEVMLRTIAEFLYTTGARISETLAMDVGDLDFENHQVKLLGKGRKERMVPVGRGALQRTQTYLKSIRPLCLRNPREQAFWLSRSGGRLSYSSFKMLWADYARRSPSVHKVTAHMFRRGFASELARGGADLWSISEMLGHVNFVTLKYYIHTELADLKKTHARYHPRDNGMTDNTELPMASASL
jgi:site-specific recombinase XerD